MRAWLVLVAACATPPPPAEPIGHVAPQRSPPRARATPTPSSEWLLLAGLGARSPMICPITIGAPVVVVHDTVGTNVDLCAVTERAMEPVKRVAVPSRTSFGIALDRLEAKRPLGCRVKLTVEVNRQVWSVLWGGASMQVEKDAPITVETASDCIEAAVKILVEKRVVPLLVARMPAPAATTTGGAGGPAQPTP